MPCLLCVVLALQGHEALEGVLSSQMVIHVYMGVKSPEETSALLGQDQCISPGNHRLCIMELMILVENTASGSLEMLSQWLNRVLEPI